MAITKFIPEVWAAALLSVLDKSLVYAGEQCTNRNYEGEISAFGDTVHITGISDPTIAPYTKDTNLSDPEALTDAEQLLVIDQAQAFNFQLDDIDKAQSRNSGALMDEASRRAGFGLRDKADILVGSRMAAAAGKGLGVINASSTASEVYDKVLVPASVALDEANVPEEERFIVLPPAVYGKLQLDGRFIKANESGTAALHNGVVGDAAGFKILKSNNSPTRARSEIAATTTNSNKNVVGVAGTFSQADVGLAITGTGIQSSTVIESVNESGTTAVLDKNANASGSQTDLAIAQSGKIVIAGSRIANTYAEQILEVEAYRPEKRFADALKGLHVYGSKVVRPSGLIVSSVVA